MQDFFQNIRQFISRLSRGQQVALGLVVLGGLAIILSIAVWSSQTDHALLFSDLSPSDANTVVESLRDEGISYELRQNGTAIYVPRNQVYELRMRYASEGLISDGQVGYELFDNGNMGMTDFMQEMNKKRALEGELARTISNMQQVDMARVHLVLPERNPFRENQVEASASVVVQHASSQKLKSAQVDGITSLVAGAVEGMDPSAVTVLDAQGNMLSDPNAGDPDARLTSTQLEIRQEIEKHLMESGQSMLDRMLGSGHSVVRVSAALDFSRTVSESDIIDPESQTVISEERLDEDSPQDNASSLVRNYEVSRTMERFEDSPGGVDELTVSVILNQKPPPDAAGEDAEPAPYTQEELDEIEAIVKNAVGFDEERGDRFAIHQTRFSPDANNPMIDQLREEQRQQQIERYIRYGLIVLALLLGVWLIRSVAKRGSELDETGLLAPGSERSEDGALVGEGQRGDDEDVEDLMLVDDVYTNKLSAEAQQALRRKHRLYQEVQNQVVEHPEEAAELVRTWLIEDAIAHERERAEKQRARS